MCGKTSRTWLRARATIPAIDTPTEACLAGVARKGSTAAHAISAARWVTSSATVLTTINLVAAAAAAAAVEEEEEEEAGYSATTVPRSATSPRCARCPKCYNCEEFAHISRDCPQSDTEETAAKRCEERGY